MAIAPTAGTTANSGNSQVASQAITVPSGVLGGDTVLVTCVVVPISSSTATITPSSTGTLPVAAGSAVTGSEPLPATITGQVFRFTASGTTGSASTDVGKVITLTFSVSGFASVTLESYSGTNTSAPVDVISGAFGGASTASVTCPTVPTGVSGDWAVFTGGGAAEGNSFALPSGTTTRQVITSAADVACGICDSNGSVGPAGTDIGGGKFTCTTATNSLLIAFTIGLAPAGGSPVPAPFTPPRKAARGFPLLGRGRGRGQDGTYTAPPPPVPAPFTAPRRPARGVQLLGRGRGTGTAGTFTSVPPPVPAPFSPPRRPARGFPLLGRGRGTGQDGTFSAAPPPVPAPFSPPRRPARGRPLTGRGSGRGQAGSGAPASPFAAPGRPARGRRLLGRGRSRGVLGAYTAPVPKTLLISLAAAAGTDQYGNPYPQGISVGSTAGSQVQLLPGTAGSASELSFPVPSPALSNTGNIAAGGIELLMSGPAIETAGEEDWVQLGMVANTGSQPAAGFFIYVDTSGGVHQLGTWSSLADGWTFAGPVVMSGALQAQSVTTLGDASVQGSQLAVGNGTTAEIILNPKQPVPVNYPNSHISTTPTAAEFNAIVDTLNDVCAYLINIGLFS